MGSKTLDFTSWYELQADTDSDEESVSSHLALPLGHGTYSPYSTGGTRHQDLQPSSDETATRHTGRASLIQQLLDEMDDANQKIDQFYDGKKPHGGTSLEEFPFGHRTAETDESGCDEVVSSAIAEVSKNFITGNLSAGPLASAESDESHISSDNDFRHRRGAAYAKYPETAAGLSDNDWNPYVTESDTNNSPRLTGDLRPVSILASGGDSNSKINSLVTSFNPPFCSTKTGSASRISKSSLQLIDSRPATDSSLLPSDIKETSALSSRSIASFAPDSSISPPQLTSSKLSEYSFGRGSSEAQHFPSTSVSQYRDLAARNLRKCFERTSWPPESVSSGRASQGSDEGTGREFGQSQFKTDSGIDYTRVEESFKQLSRFVDDADKSSWEIKSSLPGREYFSDAVHNALSTDDPSDGKPAAEWERGGRTTTTSGVNPTSYGSYLTKDFSVERFSADSRRQKGGKATERPGLTRISRDSDARTSATNSSTETVIPVSMVSNKDPSLKHTDYLTVQVDKLLQQTAYLTSSSRAKEREEEKEKKGTDTATTSLDYDRLHRDLQEIQESLHTMGQPAVESPHPATTSTASTLQPPTNTASAKSDSDDADIVPSTTTTPERGRRLMWDYGGDLGYGQEGMMSDVTAESSPLDPLHPNNNNNKNQYTSDGEETRTSSLDHGGEEEEHHEDTTMTFANQVGQAAATARNGLDFDDLVSTFRNESRALDTRYQAVLSQGMADKVINILTSTNPDQQAQGILSQVSAEERERRHRISSQAQGDRLDGSYASSLSSTLLASKSDDPVRKRLDLSSLSDSAENSQLLQSFFESQPKLEAAFSATTFAQTLISEQMKKMADRTFNHSLELRTPVHQELQCYPVYSTQRDQPQYQQLQAQLHQQLQQQQQQRGEQAAAKAASEKERGAGAAKSPRGESAEKQLESLNLEEKAKVSGGSGDESPGGGTSPADSDKSSELRSRGKYRPYRPAGSQDVYYTESDTASVAESITTVESTHTGSDDAMGPYFPSSVLGSRQDPAGDDKGLYSKRGKPAGPAGSSVDLPLPTIQERATPDPRERSSSDSSSRTVTGQAEGGRMNPASASGTSVPGANPSVSEVMARRQARVDDILREKDSARKVPASESADKDPLEKTKGEEMLEAYRAQKTDPLRARTPSPQPSKIPVRGPPLDYSAALRSKQEDELRLKAGLDSADGDICGHDVNAPSSLTDRPTRLNADKRDSDPDDSTEIHLLKAIDAELETEILERHHTESSSDQNDNASGNRHQESSDPKDTRASDRPTASRSEETAYSRPGNPSRGESSRSQRASDRPTTSRTEETAYSRQENPSRGESSRSQRASDRPTTSRTEETAYSRQENPSRGESSRSQRATARPTSSRTQETAYSIQGNPSRGESSRSHDTERERRWREAEAVVQKEQGRLEIDKGQADKRHEKTALLQQKRQEAGREAAKMFSQRAQGRQEVDQARANKRREEEKMDRRRLKELQDTIAHSPRSAARIAAGERDVDQGVAAKRREESELERRSLEVQITRERETMQAARLVREQELRETVVRRELTVREAEARRQASMQREVELRRERELIASRRGAELRAVREADARQEPDTRGAEQQNEETLNRDAELRRAIIQQREAELQENAEREAGLHRIADVRLAAEIEEEAEQRRQLDAAAVTEDALSREVRRARELARQRQDPLREAERQREAEEAIARAGGGQEPMTDAQKEADKEMQQRGHELPRQRETQEAIDRKPLSHRAQLLREALEKEAAYQGRPDLHFMWERFLAGSNVGQEPDSSLSSEKLTELADLMRDPTHHLVHSFLSQRQMQHQQDMLRAEAQREAVRRREEDSQLLDEESAALERELRRQDARQQQHRQSSEEESNGSYGEIIQQRERDRLRRREIRTQRKKQGKPLSPSKSLPSMHQPPSPDRGGDTMETLYSIPEDTGMTPQKSRSPHRSQSQNHNHNHPHRRSHVIDPNMVKLRERITQQRQKIGHERVKEIKRLQKLERLKALLLAKRTGLLDDSTVAAHLATISSTSASSEGSVAALSQVSLVASELSDNTTTAKDSSTEMRKIRFGHSPVERRRTEVSYHDNDSVDTDEFIQLLEDSCSQTESEHSIRINRRGHGVRDSHSQSHKRLSPSTQPSKQGGKCLKLHQMYSPYKRGEVFKPTKKSRRSEVQFEGVDSKTRDFGAMYPSPKQPQKNHNVRVRVSSRQVSQGVQTSPKRTHSTSSPYQDRPAVPAPTMNQGRGMQTRGRQASTPQGRQSSSSQRTAAAAHGEIQGGKMPRQSRSVSPEFDSRQVAACLSPDRDRPRSASSSRSDLHRMQRRPAAAGHREIQGGKMPRQSRSVSPEFDSRQVAACLSPDRDRPRSASPSRSDLHRRRSPSPIRHRSPSTVEVRVKAWTEQESRVPLRNPGLSGMAAPCCRHGKHLSPTPPPAVSWFIPMTDDKAWQSCIKEPQATAAFRHDCRPMGLSQNQWRELARVDLEEAEGGLRGSVEGEATRMYLHRTTKEAERELRLQYDQFEEKPLCRMSLQEALVRRRPDFISGMRQRQKLLKLSGEERQFQALVRAERELLFHDQRITCANPDAHPYSLRLHMPTRRVFSKQEMKEITEKNYNSLPEVKAKVVEQQRSEEYKLNRLRAKVFNRRVQRTVLARQGAVRCSC
ncbi:microtubule-associated protein futsch-like [Littorina saxatilis]|uniref:ALMS motif domain-containing protein n=1 Tax=Littorina saxatilis TaxID=31220 RepID=A0AAN9BTP0_9CAEN